MSRRPKTDLPVNGAWWQPVRAVDPVQLVREAIASLRSGRAPCREATALIADALQGYLDGDHRDIAKALGIRPGRGGAAAVPARKAARESRDDFIRSRMAAKEGAAGRHAEGVCALLRADPASLPITEADIVQRLQRDCAAQGVSLQLGARQIQRIAGDS